MRTPFSLIFSRIQRALLAAAFALSLGFQCGAASSATQPAQSTRSEGRVREPAVAGLFYPKNADELARDIDKYIAGAPTNSVNGVRALICPHAGYSFSGPVAARAYRLIAGSGFDRVIIIGPSHYAWFQGVSVAAADEYRTPLGKVPVWKEAREQLAKQAPFVLEPRSLVQRPAWAGTASKLAPPAGQDTPDTWEHSVEVQVPFVQRTLKQVEVLPLVFGVADPAEAAKALAPLITENTLVIASSDLSHYHPYDEARKLDQETLKWICDTNIATLTKPAAEDRACGRLPILTLLHLAQTKGWKPQLLDYRNSGDTSGDKSRVVGYGALAFVASGTEAASANPAAEAKAGAQFNAAERKFLLELARKTLQRVTAGEPLPEVKLDTVPPACRAQKGCFVTLKKSGELRGCIGNIMPVGPLFQSVMDNARSAALRDPRFAPVTADEARSLHIEVSVLTVPEPLSFSSPQDLLAKLQPGRDGVVLRIGQRGATFLPQVWEQLPEKTDFMAHLAAKAGCPPSAWQGKDVSVSIYHAEAFDEPE